MWKVIGFSLLVSSYLFFSACQSPQEETPAFEISAEERVWLSEFFKNIMLNNHGIYTLWGSKPITLIVIDDYTKEEREAFFQSLSDAEKKEYFSIESSDLLDDWKKWEKISYRFPMNRYVLFKTDLFDEPHTVFVLLVDMLKTATTIQEHYTQFREVVGFDFSPLEMALEIKQKDSKFWKKIENSYLLGLLFGYGKTNSTLFHWKHFDHPQSCDEFCKNMQTLFSNERKAGYIKYTIDNFDIPDFISFDDNDLIIEKYKEERTKIQQLYKGKDFLNMTLKKLTS